MNESELVCIEYDLEPGQLVFIEAIVPSTLEEENVDSPSPAMFIEGEGSDNASFRVLNLDTE